MDLYSFEWLLLLWNILVVIALVFIGIFIYKLYKYITRER